MQDSQVVTQPQETRSPVSKHTYVFASVVAVIALLVSIAYGGYQVYLDGKDAKAAEEFDLNPREIAAQLAIEGDYEGASEVYEGLLADGSLRGSNREQIEVKSWLGCCYNALGKYEEAEAILAEVNAVAPNKAPNHFFMACALASQGKDDKALRAFADYMLLGGVYPRENITFKVAHQLEHLEASGQIDELLAKPQMGFKFAYGWRAAASDISGQNVGSTNMEVDLEMPSMTLDFWSQFPRNNREFDSWKLVCYLDPSKNEWRGRLVTENSAIGEFVGTLEEDRLAMLGTWIPATGGAPVPAKLTIEQSQSNDRLTHLQILCSMDGSKDWEHAMEFCSLSMSRN